MAKIISRTAPNDLHAFFIAQGMEDAGAQVISISHNGQKQDYGALAPSSKFIVWARYEEPLTCDDIDDFIEKAYPENF
jgi:hypothetical protein